MPRPLTTINLTPGVTSIATDMRQHDHWVWLNNESSLNCVVTTAAESRTLPGSMADLFDLTGDSGAPSLLINPSIIINNVAPAVITGDVYLDTEIRSLPQKGLVPLARQGLSNVVNPLPLTVASLPLTHITNPALITYLATTLTNDGLYRLTFSLSIHNTNAANKPTLICFFTEASGAIGSIYFTADDQNPATGSAAHNLDGGSSSFGAGYGPVSMLDEVIYAKAAALTVQYSTTGATTSDYLAGIIERVM